MESMTLREFADAVLDGAKTLELASGMKDGERRYWMDVEDIVVWGAKGKDDNGKLKFNPDDKSLPIYVIKNDVGFFLTNNQGLVADKTITLTV